MGVKSTVTLTRAEACERVVDLLIDKLRLILRDGATVHTNEHLEDLLEQLNDEAHDGEGFENYIIRG